MNLTEDTFVRHLPYSAVRWIAARLDIDNLWERLAIKIPKKPDLLFTAAENDFDPKYTYQDIQGFREKNSYQGGSCTKALIINWGTQNCRLKHLVEALHQAELYAVADYVQRELLHQEPVRPRQQRVAPNGMLNPPGGMADPAGHSLIPNNTNTTNSSSDNNSYPSSSSCANKRVTEQVRPIPTDPPSSQSGDHLLLLMLNSSSHPERAFDDAISTHSSQNTMDERVSHSSGAKQSVLGEGTQNPAADTAVPSVPTQIAFNNDMEKESADFDIDLESLEGSEGLKHIRYGILQDITNDFDKRRYRDGGNLIGEGGFGTVFLGTFQNGYKVAIKLMKDNTEDIKGQFDTEMMTLNRFKHDNLVYLLGYCKEPLCLVYQYMPNGSLEERLACLDNTPPLSNTMRLNIAKGTARGIAFLHNEGLVHRDIKSANILLDDKYNPKVGDFATARVLPAGMTTMINASVVIGTAAYLAPEAYNFIIKPSLDVYSYGVVLLEILTGLPVIDHSREEVDLKGLVLEHCSEGEDDEETGTIFDLLDKRGGEWQKETVDALYSISCRCLEHLRKKRPKIADVLSELEKLTLKFEAPESE